MSKTLDHLMEGLEYSIYRQPEGMSSDDVAGMEIPDVVSDERRLSAGCLFICCPITNHNGARCINKAIDAGASVIVTEKGLYEDRGPRGEHNGMGTAIIFVDDSRYAMAFIYAAWHDHPAGRMTTIGVTGTKGKTTVCHMLHAILAEAGRRAGLVSTVEYITGEEHEVSPITTPEADILQDLLHRMADAGDDTAVIEVASQALMTHRSQGFRFDIGIYTNLGTDHIGKDEHRDFDHYLYCKSLLMQQCDTGIVNIDDPYAERILKGHTCEVKTCGLSPEADFRAEDITYRFVDGIPGVEFDAMGMHITMPLPGDHSVSNALAAIGAALCLKIPRDAIVRALRNIRVDGRMDIIKPDDAEERDLPTVIVDFAHNELSLERLLQTLRHYYSGKLICVICSVGAASKWEPIGKACGENADYTVVTELDGRYGNRFEDVAGSIAGGIRQKNGEYVIIRDHREAICHAISLGGASDLVAVCGRGHLTGQIFGGRTYPLPSDADLVREAFARFTFSEN